MVSTHVAVGVLITVVLKTYFPELPTLPLLASGFVGGALPDLDRYGTHRSDLHYPISGAVATVLFGIVFLAYPSERAVSSVLLAGVGAF